MPSRFWRNRPCLPFSISLKDFKARLPGPVTGLPRRPLSIRASTASCSIRFSLRTMISGAPNSSRRFKRLLRLITLLYKSFKSEVANRPPSSCTIGRSSGGITGITSRIIHSGRFPELRNASTTSRRRTALIRRCPVESRISARSSSLSFSRSMSSSRRLTASAPIPAVKRLPYFSRYSRYSVSLSSCFFAKGVSPGSRTTYEAKYKTLSKVRGDMSKIKPMRLGIPLKNQI